MKWINMPFRGNHLDYFTMETRVEYEKILSCVSNLSSCLTWHSRGG
jgi:hypothetical protein